jgi:lipopolysaccharide biosynthesis glycosyltransferase
LQLDVAYSSDEHYVPHAAASIVSLFQSNRSFSEIHVNFLDFGIQESSKNELKRIVAENHGEITFLDGAALLRENMAIGAEISYYGRLFLPQLVDLDRILYIDGDTIICHDLAELWETDLEGYLIGAVQDVPADYLVTAIGMAPEERYINSGVVLFNLKEWREQKVLDQCIQFINLFHGDVPHRDQGTLNGVCKGKIKILPPRFNMMPEMIYMSAEQVRKLYHVPVYYSQEEINDAVKDPVIIHFLAKLYNRPWFQDCSHPMKEKYRLALSQTNFSKALSMQKPKMRIRFQKWVYQTFPFEFYSALQKVLDIRRKRLIKEHPFRLAASNGERRAI